MDDSDVNGFTTLPKLIARLNRYLNAREMEANCSGQQDSLIANASILPPSIIIKLYNDKSSEAECYPSRNRIVFSDGSHASDIAITTHFDSIIVINVLCNSR
jgi:hypothetical protein